MASWCPNCGKSIDEGERFCRRCGMPLYLTGDAATEWVRSNPTAPASERPTEHMVPQQTAPSSGQTGPAYVPPAYLTPTTPPTYYHPAQQEESHISLGEWLGRGWKVYKENWFVMSLGTLLSGFLGLVTIGILAGPMLMGLYRMAFKTMRGERPEINDLFQWEGRFGQAFLAVLIFVLIQGGVSGMDRAGAFAAIFSFVASPFLTVILSLTMPLILERRMDVAKAINEAGRLIFTKDALMWWIVGLVFAAISLGGVVGCGVGILVTIPWMISSSAVAYRDLFTLDDPNRTNS
jgi:zinc-ribbon domain